MSEAVRHGDAGGALPRRPLRLHLLRDGIYVEGNPMITIRLLLLILALVCFLASAVNVASPRVNLTAAGLALWVLSLLLLT